ncbi:hypothetical protein BDF22DRAFT_778014 [Syncephalis plumigaleata]|nr:hypothetical protein BDF22DRAFT_778014 [Syncephalis plumigaleata]
MESTQKQLLPFHYGHSDYSSKLHPRNRYYNAPPDFAELAKTYPTFAPYIIKRSNGTVIIDFKRPEVQRLNYLHWLEDLIGQERVNETIHGIDIGTGASCIYPLLGCRLHDTWQFMATELQERLVEIARENIDRNELTLQINLVQAHADHVLPVERIMAATHDYDFCMCNPPFYASKEELEQSAANKQTESVSVCHASSDEMVTPGGEVAFVTRMLEESRTTRTKVGKRSSILQVTATEFCQGRTRRWAVGWSYTALDSNTSATTHLQFQPTSKRLRRTLETFHERTHPFPDVTMDPLRTATRHVLDAIVTTNDALTWHDDNTSFTIKLPRKTWSREERRGRRGRRIIRPNPYTLTRDRPRPRVEGDPMIIVRGTIEYISLAASLVKKTKGAHTILQLRLNWIHGTNRQLFNSFAAHVFTQIRSHINKHK